MAASTQRLFDAVASPIRREILWLTWADELLGWGARARASRSPARRCRPHLDAAARRRDSSPCGSTATSVATAVTRTPSAPWCPSSRRATSAGSPPTTSLSGRSPPPLWPPAVTVAVEVPVAPERGVRGLHRRTPLQLVAGVRRSASATGGSAPPSSGARRCAARTRSSSPPDLIAMRWDFDDETVPLPGRGARRVPAGAAGARGLPRRGAPARRRPGAGGLPHRRLVDGARSLRRCVRRGRGAGAGTSSASSQASPHGPVGALERVATDPNEYLAALPDHVRPIVDAMPDRSRSLWVGER